MAKKKHKPEEVVCARCGNPIYPARYRLYVKCQWCGWKNKLESSKELRHG